ncbi:MAG TPA: SBBP repeat-containing protein, partial [Anaerolineaceae bacterium]|nr:SBBP repeat-containing protein [Anaerolineaceae bacterium]
MPAALSTSVANLDQIPLAFVPNEGQTASDVIYQVHDLNGTVFLTASELVFALANQQTLRLGYRDSNPEVQVVGDERLSGTLNYLIGDEPDTWRTHLPVYGSVVYYDLYPGIDLRYEGQMGTVESVYTLAPRADPGLIRWQHSGVQAARIQKDGSLALYQNSADSQPVLVEQAPLAWQEIAGRKAPVACRFYLYPDGSLGFTLGAYDPAYALIIDPTLVYSSYIGGSEMETAGGVALDEDGNIFIAGSTGSVDFPTQSGYQTEYDGWNDVFVMKLDPSGTNLIYGTYLGGNDDDEASDIQVDATGNIYITGDTSSTDFPTRNAYQAHCAKLGMMCMGDVFLAKLNPSGDQLLYATYLGGGSADTAEGLSVGENGLVYMAGTTFSTGFPTQNAIQSSLKGSNDAFIAGLDPSLSGSDSFVFGTFLGGGGSDYGTDLALAGGNRLVVVGETVSTDFPTQDPLQASKAGDSDAFITALSLDGGSLIYSTYLGGGYQDAAYQVATNANGDAFVTGKTFSTDFPMLHAAQPSKGGDSDAFITGINATGSAWLMSSYWGGSSTDTGYAVAVDANGAVYVGGDSYSKNFPRKDSTLVYKGEGDAFIAKFIVGNEAAVYSTLLGGSSSDYAGNLVVDAYGHIFASGVTYSSDFPTQDGFNSAYSGNGDVFLVEISDAGAMPSSFVPASDFYPLKGSYLAASKPSLQPGEELVYTLYLHNSGTEAVFADVVD